MSPVLYCKRCEGVIGNTDEVSQEEIKQFKEKRKWSNTLSDEQIAKQIINSNIRGIWAQFGVDGNYCRDCLDEFTEAYDNGALTIRKWSFEAGVGNPRGYEISTKQNTFIGHTKGDGMSQVEAIVKAREIAKDEEIDTIIFTYAPHGSIWFLENYLEAHPKIRENVLESETSLADKIRGIF